MERNEDRTMKGISVKLFFRTSSVPQKTQQSVRSYVMRQIVRLEQNGRSIINETYLSVYIRVLSLKAYWWLYRVKYAVLEVQSRKSEAYFPVF